MTPLQLHKLLSLLMLPLLLLAATGRGEQPVIHIAHLDSGGGSLTLTSTVAGADGQPQAVGFSRDVPCRVVPTLEVFARDAFPRNPRTDPDYPSPAANGAPAPGNPGAPVPLRLRLTFAFPSGHEPAPGRLQLLSGDADRAPTPLGSAPIPGGCRTDEEVVLDLGPAPGFTAVRTQTSFRATPDGADESFRIALHNATPRRATVQVVETFARGPRYALTAASHESRPGPRPDTLAFDVVLSPRGDATLTYSAHYDFSAPAATAPIPEESAP